MVSRIFYPMKEEQEAQLRLTPDPNIVPRFRRNKKLFLQNRAGSLLFL